MIKFGPNKKYKMNLRSGRISKKYNHFFKKPVLLFRKKKGCMHAQIKSMVMKLSGKKRCNALSINHTRARFAE